MTRNRVDLTVHASAKREFEKHFSDRSLKAQAQKLLRLLELESSVLSVVITDDREIQRLNNNFRQKNMPTDVLSFPLGDAQYVQRTGLLGDVVISVPTAKRQAKAFSVSVREELLRLLIHGVLHLLGFDHENVPRRKALKMARKERELHASFGLREGSELEVTR